MEDVIFGIDKVLGRIWIVLLFGFIDDLLIDMVWFVIFSNNDVEFIECVYVVGEFDVCVLFGYICCDGDLFFVFSFSYDVGFGGVLVFIE